ncbi:MAG: tetratricopeptide repeat protein [Sandaracinaceae bacterium]
MTASPARAARNAAFVLVWLLAWAPLAEAQGDEGTPPEAVQFYTSARENYEAGRYQEAADDLERALMLDPDSPTLVYNLARVYELLGQPARALVQYERYQQLLPQQQARDQERAAATIRRLEGAAASNGPPRARPSPREVAPLLQLPGLVLVRENGVADGLFWGMLVGGGALVVLGATLGALALAQRSAVDGWVLGRDGSLSQQVSAQSTAQSLGIGADVCLGVGGALVIASLLVYFLRDHTVERAPLRAVDEDDDGPSAAAEPTTTIAIGPLGIGVTF